MALWRSGYAEVCKTLYTGSIPVGASMRIKKQVLYGRVAELVYAFDLKSNDESHTGSSPVSATKTSSMFRPPTRPKG